MRLLVVEDEKDLNNILVKSLEKEGYNVEACLDGIEAWDYLSLAEYDGAIIDIMLPGMSGFDLLKKMREEKITTPVLFLSALDDTDHIVNGLNLGADDYLVKPFVMKELLARIRVMTRRKPEIQENIYRCGDLVIDYNTREVTRAGKSIWLSPKEFNVLLYLVRNKNIIVSREQIETNVWNIMSTGNSNLVDVYIRYLRRKIDDDFEDKMICTIRGTGYMLKCEE